MAKVIFVKGIQGAGKTFWAKNYCEKNPDWVRISRDDLRNMRGKYWMPKREKLITAWVYNLIKEALTQGYNLVIDEMNLNEKNVQKIKDCISHYIRQMQETIKLALKGEEDAREKYPKIFIFENMQVHYEVKDFTSVPLEVCIERDQQRANSIGEKVLRDTWAKYLAPKTEPIKQDHNLPHAIICDLDGTLALFGNKSPYDRDFINDELNQPIRTIINIYLKEHLDAWGKRKSHLIIFSGRSARFKPETSDWLKKNCIEPDVFQMRSEEEEQLQIKDVKVKQRMFDTYAKDKYYIDFVLDDRNQVVKLWRSLGLTCLQVADGDF